MITKPLRISRVNWSNPLTRGLIICCAINEMAGNPANIVTANPGVLGNGVWTPDGVKFPSATSNYYVDLLSTGLSLPTGPCTVMVRYRKLDSVNRVSSAFGRRGAPSLTTRLGCLLPYSDGTIYWDYGGATAGTTRLVAAGLTGFTQWSNWAFTVGTRGMEIWRDGLLVASNAANPTRVNDGSPWGLGQNDSPSGASDVTETSLVYLFNRQMSATEIRNLNANPWQLLTQSSARSILARLTQSFTGVSRGRILSGISRGRLT